MSLLSIDISKVKRLSLKGAKPPAPELKEELPTTTQTDSPLTQEEIVYNILLAKSPLLERLVDRLGLVSSYTGERIKKAELRAGNKPYKEPEIKLQDEDKPKLIALAQRVTEAGNSYTREELIDRIRRVSNVTGERAERGFKLLLEAGAIDVTPDNKYYLATSTPF